MFLRFTRLRARRWRRLSTSQNRTRRLQLRPQFSSSIAARQVMPLRCVSSPQLTNRTLLYTMRRRRPCGMSQLVRTRSCLNPLLGLQAEPQRRSAVIPLNGFSLGNSGGQHLGARAKFRRQPAGRWRNRFGSKLLGPTERLTHITKTRLRRTPYPVARNRVFSTRESSIIACPGSTPLATRRYFLRRSR